MHRIPFHFPCSILWHLERLTLLLWFSIKSKALWLFLFLFFLLLDFILLSFLSYAIPFHSLEIFTLFGEAHPCFQFIHHKHRCIEDPTLLFIVFSMSLISNIHQAISPLLILFILFSMSLISNIQQAISLLLIFIA